MTSIHLMYKYINIIHNESPQINNNNNTYFLKKLLKVFNLKSRQT